MLKLYDMKQVKIVIEKHGSSITEFPVYEGKRKGPMAATVPSLIALDR